jgi:phosphoribosylglycinamide formyltransferase 1
VTGFCEPGIWPVRSSSSILPEPAVSTGTFRLLAPVSQPQLPCPAMTMRIAVAISGRGSNLEALHQALKNGAAAKIVVAVSDRPDAGGLDRARHWGIPTEVLPTPTDGDAWIALLRRYAVDLVVLAGYVKLVPANVIAMYRGRIVNVHPALLPAFGGRGMYGRRVHEAVLASGARESGATVHLVDEAYDHGATLGQARVPILPGDTPELLAQRVLEVEHRLLPAVVLAAAQAGHPVPLADPVEF